jgi:hypothetical protein
MIDESLLELPKVVIQPKIEKSSFISKPNIETLTEEQSIIFKEITEMPLNNFSQILLTGYAGSGKTFLVSKIIEQLLFKNKHLNIAITAPTHKAVRVLRDSSSISEDSNRVSFITLHSLLALKRVITNEGKEVFKEVFGGSEINQYEVVLVDEVSMLDNELYNSLIFQAEINNIMLIFIGDRGQIPPVNGGESILFKSKLDKSYNLTKIIRQGSDNPIIGLAEKVRSNKKFEKKNIIDKNKNGVIFLKLKTEEPLLNVYFNSLNFKKNPNFVKVLSHRNSAVKYYNDMIRTLIYGEGCGMLCVGEKMVCNKPILNIKNQVLLNNNDEFEVVSFVLKQEKRAYDFWYYSVDIINDGRKLTINILAEKSFDSFAKEVKRLKTIAEKAKVMTKRNAWSKYYKLLERYADVNYNYALTIHKSQGSTFDNVIVINCDIERVPNVIERNKLLYTAITRAKNKLFMI